MKGKGRKRRVEQRAGERGKIRVQYYMYTYGNIVTHSIVVA